MGDGFNIAEQTLAVLVIYNIDPQASSTFLSLEKALSFSNVRMDLLIYDNSPDHHKMPASEHWNVRYHHDPSNGGVSKAYNWGCDIANDLNKKWLCLLDQDDIFSDQTIEEYLKAVQENPNESIFVPIISDEKSIISPFFMRFGGGWRISKIIPGTYDLKRFLLINSGLFISVKTFIEAGGYDENFPLDFSDLDFIHRLRRIHETFKVIPIHVHHNLSINAAQTLEDRLKRFHIYISAAKRFQKKYRLAVRSILLRSFLMSLKLSFRHHSLQFLKKYFILWS